MGLKIEVSLNDLHQLQDRVERRSLVCVDWEILGALVSNLVVREEAKVARLIKRNSADNAVQTESITNPKPLECDQIIDVEHNSIDDPVIDSSDNREKNKGKKSRKKSKGHGRNGAAAYSNAQHIFHMLPEGTLGSMCGCGDGRLNKHREQITIRVVGQPMFGAEQHHAQQARCKMCGRVVTAPIPNNVLAGLGKSVVYHWSACAMLIVLHYFSGLPFKRLESLHQSWGIPFADANQWDTANSAMNLLAPLFQALERYGIQNALSLRMDDTGTMILSIKKQITAELAAAKALGISDDNIRTGINTSGFYLETADGIVILFYSGRHHAGEILRKIVRHRKPESGKFPKITDGASKNFDASNADWADEGACNAHAFLKFDEIKKQFPTEYAIVGESYDEVFKNEEIIREQKLPPKERLAYHQKHSRVWMEKIKAMCMHRLTNNLVEPRSPLWAPVRFFLNQWDRLTKFLSVPGMPLDTNLIEQGLIIPVRYLAASFNFHTEKGAKTGDQAMSLVATARANKVEPVAWISHCLEHHEDLAKNPEKYLPWVYRDQKKSGDRHCLLHNLDWSPA